MDSELLSLIAICLLKVFTVVTVEVCLVSSSEICMVTFFVSDFFFWHDNLFILILFFISKIHLNINSIYFDS